MRRFACNGDSATSKPPTATLPSVGGMKPVIIRMVVDLPAPFGPRKPSTSPRLTVNEIPSTARFAPKDFTRLSILIIKLGSFLTVQGGGLSPKNAAAPAAEASRRAILRYSFSFLPSPRPSGETNDRNQVRARRCARNAHHCCKRVLDGADPNAIGHELRAHRRPGRQGRGVGADAAGARRQDARHGESDAE